MGDQLEGAGEVHYLLENVLFHVSYPAARGEGRGVGARALVNVLNFSLADSGGPPSSASAMWKPEGQPSLRS